MGIAFGSTHPMSCNPDKLGLCPAATVPAYGHGPRTARRWPPTPAAALNAQTPRTRLALGSPVTAKARRPTPLAPAGRTRQGH